MTVKENLRKIESLIQETLNMVEQDRSCYSDHVEFNVDIDTIERISFLHKQYIVKCGVSIQKTTTY